MTDLGIPCPVCNAYHGFPPLEHLKAGEPCSFDPNRLCCLCNKPVMALSYGGPDICPRCDTGVKLSPSEEKSQ